MRKSATREFVDDVVDYIPAVAAVVLPVVGVGAGISAVHHKIEAKKAAQITEQTDNDTASSKMMKSAYQGDLEGFKQALKDGADIKAVNRDGQDVLIVALSGASYEIASYILDTPELANQIDYKRCDNNGVKAQDIVAKTIESKCSSRHLASSRQTAVKMLDVYKKIIAGTVKQTLEEAQGKARSDTNYDLFEMVDNNILQK